jgi:GrpB-like predicted nucleotidyltransferase (UPF0157 family)
VTQSGVDVQPQAVYYLPMDIMEISHRWQKEAEAEQARLLAALGEITLGGVVAEIQHIGATSVPGVPARPCVDLALAVTPFPLDPDLLATLGYTIANSQSSEYEQRALHKSGYFQLFISEQGSDEWTNHLLIRDYLRADEDAQWRYAAKKPDGDSANDSSVDSKVKSALFAELVAAARRWWPTHYGFSPVNFVVQELEGFPYPWYISSGWALDLFLGRVTRVHHDVDIVVARTDQLALREHLAGRGWRFVTPLKGELEPWPPHMRLELPRHQAHAHREGQFIDFLLTDLTPDLWRYRRNPIIVRPTAQATKRTSEGIPYLAPEVVLLFKSKNTGSRARLQDQADYENVYLHLEPEARAWLRWALIATDPIHPWIAQLV